MLAIALALFVIIAGVTFLYLEIGREQREIRYIREKIDFNEETIKKISGFFIAIKNELSTT
jgi:DNA-dependent RNA polymerase auxiliary subunit epsilon